MRATLICFHRAFKSASQKLVAVAPSPFLGRKSNESRKQGEVGRQRGRRSEDSEWAHRWERQWQLWSASLSLLNTSWGYKLQESEESWLDTSELCQHLHMTRGSENEVNNTQATSKEILHLWVSRSLSLSGRRMTNRQRAAEAEASRS